MQIRSINLEHFRKFTSPVKVANLADGITIIAGDNEDGKSTILRALKAAFHTKHNSDAAAKELQSYGTAVAPTVSVEFDLGGNRYIMSKSFGKKGTAEFRTPSGEFKGSEAEEKLYELCGLGGDKDKKEKSIFNVLWVEQGTAFESPNVQDIGKRSLESALEGELGEIVGGSTGQLLIKRIKVLYDKWFTSTGKDKRGADASEFVQAQDQHAQIRAEYDKFLGQFQEFESVIKRLDDVKEALKSYEQQQSLSKARQLVEALQKKSGDLATKREALNTLNQTLQAKSAQFQNAQKDFDARTTAANAVSDQVEALKKLASGISQIQTSVEPATKVVQELSSAKESAEKLISETEQKFKYAELVVEVADQLQQKAELTQRYAKAKDAAEQANAVRKEIDAIKIDSKTLDELRKLQRDYDLKQAQLKAASIKIEFNPQSGRTVERNGQHVPNNEAIDVVEATSFTLDNWGEIKVTPGAGQLSTLTAQNEQSLKALNNAFQAANVSDVATAEQMSETKQTKLQKWNELKGEVSRWAPDGPLAITAKLQVIEGELDACFANDPSLKELTITVDAAKSQRQELRLAFETARKNATELASKLNQAKQQLEIQSGELQKMQAQEKVLSEQLSKLQADLASQREKAADETLAQNLAVAKVEREKADKKLAQAKAQLAAANADTLDGEIAAAKKNVLQIEELIRQLENEKNTLAGQLQNAGSTGVQEEVVRYQGKLELAQEQMNRAEKKAKAIKLLYETLIAAEKNSKDELVLPLVRHLQPYVADVFADGKLVLNQDNFGVTKLNRNASEDFLQLSLGTREQLSILTRLAFAQVLQENGLPAVLVLDDALVYSDRKRLLKMQEVLRRASEKFQVLIFTCHEHNYSEMGVPLLRLVDCILQPAKLNV